MTYHIAACLTSYIRVSHNDPDGLAPLASPNLPCGHEPTFRASSAFLLRADLTGNHLRQPRRVVAREGCHGRPGGPVTSSAEGGA